MNQHCSHISSILQEALVIAWLLDHFKTATVTLELECHDGKTATITETMAELIADTLETGSQLIQTPPKPKSLADSLGDIKKHEWF